MREREIDKRQKTNDKEIEKRSRYDKEGRYMAQTTQKTVKKEI